MSGKLNYLDKRLAAIEATTLQRERKLWLVDKYEDETDEAALARQGVTPAPEDLVVFMTNYLERT